ncbi:MAG: RHS repeat-associated core domain-containing protein [Clostridia bacterium]|nr:RHS repeat-associated core domain-containing protein [Clostridia bacterium]
MDLVSRHTADDIYYYLFNGHGDVTHLLNEKGDILKDYRYDPFGKDIQEPLQLTPGKTTISLWRNEVEKLDNPFRYAGEYLDQETGYYYLRARYYDPQIQRFISEDSYAKSPSWDEHIYAYAEYNPVNLVDPTGHDAGNAGRDYSKRIVNKPTKTTAKDGKKSSSKSNTVAKAQLAVRNQTKPQVKSVTQGMSNSGYRVSTLNCHTVSASKKYGPEYSSIPAQVKKLDKTIKFIGQSIKRNLNELFEGTMVMYATGVPMVPGEGPVGIGKTSKVFSKGTGNPRLYRMMSEAEVNAVKETGYLRGGREGTTWFTNQEIKSATNAQNRLSLPQKPQYRMEFEITNNPNISGPSRVKPDFGQQGKGIEYWTDDPVQVDIINIQKLKP